MGPLFLSLYSAITFSIFTSQTQLNSGFRIISTRSAWFTPLRSSKLMFSYTTCHFLFLSPVPLNWPFFLVSHGTIVWWRWVWMCLKSDLGSSSSICKHRHPSSSVACRHDQNSHLDTMIYNQEPRHYKHTFDVWLHFFFPDFLFASLFLPNDASFPNSQALSLIFSQLFSLLSLIRIHFGSCFCCERSASV